ncbi:MAG TPA: PucR family transcriptional regulator [Baekduia sp.]|nr:PucR family transcriptional regulator [Baekduia sp.]
MSTASLTLGDLLDQPDLGLELLVGGPGARGRRILGAHSIEVPNPVPWLGDEWVMLTTCLGWQTDAAQRELVRELHAGGITALGVGIDVIYRDVPTALCEVAEELDFPVFTIPGPTAFRDVIGVVQRTTISGEIRSFSRLTAMQTYLNDALRERNPAACIVERLGKLLGADIAVVDPDGLTVEGACPVASSALVSLLSDAGVHATRIQADELTGWALPMGGGDTTAESWLIAGVGPGRVEHPLLKRAAQAALPLLEATNHLRDVRAAEERAAKRATLDALLNSATPQDAEVAAARAAAWNVDPRDGVRVLIARPIGAGTVRPAELLDRAIARLEAARVPVLATLSGGHVSLLVPERVDLETLERLLTEFDPSLRLGVGRVVHAGTMATTSRIDADLALRWNRTPSSRCLSYDDLDLTAALIAEVPADRIRPKVEQWLALLAANPTAFETLTAYFEHDLDVGRTSRALHLHPNSTRYRLGRLEELLGASLRRPATIAALHLALVAREYLGVATPLGDPAGAGERVA